jgi:hypothetical protein
VQAREDQDGLFPLRIEDSSQLAAEIFNCTGRMIRAIFLDAPLLDRYNHHVSEDFDAFKKHGAASTFQHFLRPICRPCGLQRKARSTAITIIPSNLKEFRIERCMIRV